MPAFAPPHPKHLSALVRGEGEEVQVCCTLPGRTGPPAPGRPCVQRWHTADVLATVAVMTLTNNDPVLMTVVLPSPFYG